MSKPMKRAGWAQGIYEQSATQKEDIGALRILQDGRKFRYAKMGAADVAVGKAVASAACDADVIDEACASAHAIGDYVITETITSTTCAQDYFAGGYLQINDGTGEGHQYKIASSTAVAAGTSITITLEEPLRVALVATTSEFSLIHSPWMAVVATSTEESVFAGVTPINVTAAYYFWAQTGGICCCLCEATAGVAVGQVMTLSASSGALQGIATPLDVDIAYQVGVCYGTAGVDEEYKPVLLTWD